MSDELENLKFAYALQEEYVERLTAILIECGDKLGGQYRHKINDLLGIVKEGKSCVSTVVQRCTS